MAMGPFERHLRDAIALNRARAPMYAEASGGASRRISAMLILLERALLPTARRFDRIDARYTAAGMPMLDELFVSMSSVPAMNRSEATREHGEVRAVHTAPPGALRIWRAVRRAERRDGFAAAALVLERELDAMAAYPGSDCMLRHMLESARRIATVGPALEAEAAGRGLPPPRPVLRRLFHLHLIGLPAASLIDRIARPLQARGIPILRHDLPPIPAHPVRVPAASS